MTNFNIYAAEAGVLNLEAAMGDGDLQTLFQKSEFEPQNRNWPRDTTPAQFKARVGVYIKKIIARAAQEAEWQKQRQQQEAARREALGEEGRAREDAYFAAERAAYAQVTETGQARKRRKYKIRQTLRAEFGIGI